MDPATVALFAVMVAGFAALIQERKLSFDLFKERYDAVRKFRDAATDWFELDGSTNALEPTPREQLDFWEAQANLKILFPTKVFRASLKIENAIQAARISKDALERALNDEKLPNEVKKEKYDSFSRDLQALMTRQGDLADLTDPMLRQRTAVEWIVEKAQYGWFRRRIWGWAIFAKMPSWMKRSK